MSIKALLQGVEGGGYYGPHSVPSHAHASAMMPVQCSPLHLPLWHWGRPHLTSAQRTEGMQAGLDGSTPPASPLIPPRRSLHAPLPTRAGAAAPTRNPSRHPFPAGGPKRFPIRQWQRRSGTLQGKGQQRDDDDAASKQSLPTEQDYRRTHARTLDEQGSSGSSRETILKLGLYMITPRTKACQSDYTNIHTYVR